MKLIHLAWRWRLSEPNFQTPPLKYVNGMLLRSWAGDTDELELAKLEL